MIEIALMAFTGALATTAPRCTAEEGPWCVQAAYTRSQGQMLLGQDYEPFRHNSAVLFRLDPTDHTGFAHEYRSIDLVAIDGILAASNGDLHRLGWIWRRDGSQRRYRIGGGLAVSSNVLKNLDGVKSDDLRGMAAFDQHISGPLWIGARGDDSFGRFRLYPTFEASFRSPAHELRLGFPESSWRWLLSPRLESELGIAPDGGRWSVRDSQTDERQSIVRYRSWEAAWTLRWGPFDWLTAEVRAGRTFGAEVRYQLRNSVEAAVEPRDANFAGIAASLRF